MKKVVLNDTITIKIKNEDEAHSEECLVSREYYNALTKSKVQFDYKKEELTVKDPTCIKIRKMNIQKNVSRKEILAILDEMKVNNDIEKRGEYSKYYRGVHTVGVDGKWYGVKKIFYKILLDRHFTPNEAKSWLNHLGFPTDKDKNGIYKK